LNFYRNKKVLITGHTGFKGTWLFKRSGDYRAQSLFHQALSVCVRAFSSLSDENRLAGDEISWKNVSDGGPHEANFLKLDCSRLKTVFGWKPVWNVERAMEKIVEWTLAYRQKEDMYEVMCRQIEEFVE